MRRHEVSDKECLLIIDLVPAPKAHGRKLAAARKVLFGMLWILGIGAPWRDLPERYGPWRTVYDRFSAWSQDGTLDRIVARLKAQLDEQGRIDWDLFRIDGSVVRAHREAVAVVHWHMAKAAKPRGSGIVFVVQPRFRISGGLMGGIASLLLAEVHCGVTPLARRPILGLEAPVSGPSLDHRSIHREVVVGKQLGGTGLRQHLIEGGLGNLAFQQLVAVLGEHGQVPHRIVDVRLHEPPEEQVVRTCRKEEAGR